MLRFFTHPLNLIMLNCLQTCKNKRVGVSKKNTLTIVQSVGQEKQNYQELKARRGYLVKSRPPRVTCQRDPISKRERERGKKNCYSFTLIKNMFLVLET